MEEQLLLIKVKGSLLA